MAVAGVKEHVRGRGVQQVLHACFAGCNKRGNTRVGQIRHGPLHGMHDFIGHMRGAWGVHKSDARKPWGNG